MTGYVLKKILQLILLIFAAASLIFFLLQLIPGDPVVQILGEGANVEDMQRLRQELRLDRPLWTQYGNFLSDLGNLSFGRSLFDRKPVIQTIGKYLPNTIYLALAALTIALAISFPLGVLAASRENGPIDVAVTIFTSLGLAIPHFVLGLLFILLFSVGLGWLPVSGSGTLKHLILPALTLGLSMSAFLTRLVKASVSQEMKKPYVLLARAKGLTAGRIFWRHILKNAMIPLVTAIGLHLALLLSGAIITETLFSWQGIGILLIKSIQRRDFPMTQGLVAFITLVYLLVHFLVDLSYPVLDPRIRYGREES